MPAIRGSKSKKKVRRATRGLDQVYADKISKSHLQRHLKSFDPSDTAGLAQFYCVDCAKHFESESNFFKHAKGKPHKRRVRQLREEPHSQKEAEAAVGLTTNNGKHTEERDMINADEDVDVEDVSRNLRNQVRARDVILCTSNFHQGSRREP